MRVLVTGGAGFIGSWLVESLVGAGHQVTVLDNFSEQIHGAKPDFGQPWLDASRGIDVVHSDVRDAKVLESCLARVDAVVHLAAETGTGQSMYQVDRYYDINVQATARLIEAVATRQKHVRHIVLASSRSIYGEGAYRSDRGLAHHSGAALVVPPARSAKQLADGVWEPLGTHGEPLTLIATPEDAPPSPASIYAATKLANEHTARIMADAYNLSITALRFQNVYGERQSLRNPYTGILSIFSNRMRQHVPINIFEDGLESRDFVHVSDVVNSVELALARLSPGYKVFNVGAGVPTSVITIAEGLKRVLNSTSELRVSGDFRVGDIRHCYADITLARRELGFEPKVSLSEGLARFGAWVVTQPIVEDRSALAQAELTRLGLGKAS